jgi:hypothetical protein
LQRVAIELHVSLDLQMLPGIDEGPGRRRKTHATNVKISQARASLIKDIVQPGELTLASTRIALVHKPIDDVIRQAIALKRNDAPYLAKTRRRNEDKQQRNEQTNTASVTFPGNSIES